MPDFWDTSSIAKRYVDERGSDWAAARSAAEIVVLSAMTAAEFASVVARRCAEGEFDEQRRDLLYRRFSADRATWILIQVDEVVVDRAAELALSGAFGTMVRASDAIQLASALAWFEAARARNIDPGSFVVADDRLLKAAIALELPVVNPEDYA